MTPVEELREASRLMRERATAATGGRWNVDGFGTRLPLVWADYDYDGGGSVADALADDDATHIAGMDPTVAIAVADWLEWEAKRPEAEHESGYSTGGPRLEALAVARTYLRSES